MTRYSFLLLSLTFFSTVSYATPVQYKCTVSKPSVASGADDQIFSDVITTRDYIIVKPTGAYKMNEGEFSQSTVSGLDGAAVVAVKTNSDQTLAMEIGKFRFSVQGLDYIAATATTGNTQTVSATARVLNLSATCSTVP